ncbi:MAG: glycoside hydrolase family 16 protein, partial [Muribaculaceae bacterium]|nr:glycoside hydrolase family 16 protein [Muribaculaceae bacterium]
GDNINKNPWPQCGEIDILEMGNSNGFGGNEETYFGGACHWGYYDSHNTYPMYGYAGNAPYSLQDGNYHLFTCIWDEEKISMYLDMDKNPDVKPYYEMSLTDKSSATSPGNYLHKPFHILFNLAVGGMFPGITSDSGITASLPAEMKIDWVRICQPDDDSFTFCQEYVENEENQEDPYTKPGLWGSKALTSAGETTFDFDNADDFVLIGTSAGVQDIIKGKGKNIVADYNVDDVNNFFYVWENTYSEIEPSGVNSFGLQEAYQALEVRNVGWSGAGFASTGGKAKDLSMLESDDYVLHFALKGNDIAAHRKQTLMVGNTQFVIGKADGTDPSLGDYPRDGQWYYFDIPLKVLRTLKNPLFSNPSSYYDNVVAFLSGGFGGAKLQFDNVFFYKSKNGGKEIPDTDESTEIGKYASLALDKNGKSTFDFENSYDYVPVSASDLTRGAMEGKIKLDLNVDGGNNVFYNWLYEYTTTPTYDEIKAEGSNSMGEDASFFAMEVHGEQAWSGCGFKLLTPQDLSFLDDSYWLHIAFKGDDVLMHASQTLTLGKVQFTIGPADGATPSLGDYRRDGNWYAFDIPMKALRIISNPVYPNDTSFSDNILAISTGGVPGAKLQFDNVFFYRNDTKNADGKKDETPCGPYVHKALDDNGKSTFDFNNAIEIVAINISDGVREIVKDNLRADYNVDDTNVCFYVWENTYNPLENPQGPNSFGFNEVFPALSVGTYKWSGAAYKFESARDLSMLCEDDYYLHLAMRSADYVSHFPFRIGISEDDVWITTSLSGDGLLTDFPRDGEWYYIDIPVSKLNDVAGHVIFNTATSFTKNLIHFDCGAREGTILEFDNVFFWKNTNPKRNDNLGNSAIEEICGDTASSNLIEGIFTLDGCRIYLDLEELTPGFYIVNGKKVIIK